MDPNSLSIVTKSIKDVVNLFVVRIKKYMSPWAVAFNFVLRYITQQ